MSGSNDSIATQGYINVFGAVSEKASSFLDHASEKISEANPAIGEVIQNGISSLETLMANIKIPSSLDEVFSLPGFSALKEKLSFLDTLDVNEISQERFDELVEGAFK